MLDCANLRVERLEYWRKRVFREWAFRPEPILWFWCTIDTWEGIKSGLSIIAQRFGWLGESTMMSGSGEPITR